MQKSTKMFLFQIVKIDRDGNESVLTISYKKEFIDSARFMATLLSNFVDNLTKLNGIIVIMKLSRII